MLRGLSTRNSNPIPDPDPVNPSRSSSGTPIDSNNPQFDPATMIGISEVSQGSSGDSFNLCEWYPRFQNCQRYFLDHAQHSVPVQGLSAFLNIQLPFQRQPNPIFNSASSIPTPPPEQKSSTPFSPSSSLPPSVSLIPYIRRLVATGMDFPGVLQGFFGDDWGPGIGPLHEQERRNYLFAAKSGGWASVKKDYDMPPQETIPFLRPLQGPLDSEIEAAERSWSEWLAMEDWMVGPRAPDLDSSSQASHPRSSGG